VTDEIHGGPSQRHGKILGQEKKGWYFIRRNFEVMSPQKGPPLDKSPSYRSLLLS